MLCISLELLRSGNTEAIKALLLKTGHFQKIVVNAEFYTDLVPFCQALAAAIAQGHHFMLRSAASIVKVLGGVPDQPLLTGEILPKNCGTAGLVVVGSHTQKSTAQLQALLTLPAAEGIPFRSELVLQGEGSFSEEISRARKACEDAMKRGKTAVVYTGRTLLVREDDTQESALLRSVRISDGLQTIVRELTVAPAFLIAKGGITSSDVAVKALGARRGFVLGQIKPGIPVWRTGKESLFPGVPYVIFPGNVGEENTLREIVELLTK